MKIVITVVGYDKVGIIAMVSGVLAENGVNIVNLDQNIVDGFFNMILIAEMDTAVIGLVDLQTLLSEKGREMGLDIRTQHEGIFQAMHRI